MKILKFNILIIVAIFFATACTEQIELKENGSMETRLVVDATITNEYKPHYVKLSKTRQLSSMADNRVTGATVNVLQNDSVIIFTESDTLPGYYVSEPFAGIPNSKYTLNITGVTVDKNNPVQQYTAVSVMGRAAQIDSVTYLYNSLFKALMVQCWAWDPVETNFYSFGVMLNSQILTDSLHEIFASDDALFNGRYTAGIDCGYIFNREDGNFVKPGDTITLIVQNIDKHYFDYINSSKNVSNGYNPIFGGLPSNATSNIDNNAIGIFRVYTVNTASIVVKPGFDQ